MTNVQSYQKYLSSDYPGYQSFLETIIIPIFGQKFEANAGLLQKASNPKLVDRFENIIRTSTDESLKEEAFNSGLQSMIKLGSIELDNTESPLFVYDITIGENKELSKNRKGIQTLIRRMLSKNSGAFMIFHYADKQWEWRFSYCFKGMSDEDSTNARRFTYLLGPNQACKTAAQRFDKLRKQEGRINLKDIEEAFSVEQLSKDFFRRYKAQYGKFVGYVIGKAYDEKKDQWVDAEGILPNPLFEAFGRDEKKARDYVKKLLGRIVFLHFLQKKGWMGADEEWKHGDPNFMQNLFLKSSPAQQANYLDKVLEPLFADALNTKEREGLFFDTKVEGVGNVRIPFLGGGLFERDELDEPDSVFPAKYFEDLFEFFTEYNFTIDENDPSDAEVGIDPEMLGMIFENLLEDNKDKGAFYTPKEIVQYMCRESLIAYLQTDVEDEATKQSFRDFVTKHEVSLLKPADVFKVDKKLREVKICDPAIGSGAFPMGLLKELFACRMAIEGEEEGQTAAEIKKDIIQNSIYGVDIEKGAVDIARLRFWLSLILDEDTPNALPNMDFKIMQGNSLLEQYMGVPLDDIYDSSRQMMLAFDEETTARMLLKEHMFTYFEKEDHEEKAKTLKSIDKAVKAMVKAKTLGNPDVSAAIDALDLRNNQEFFLWHTWFNDVLADKNDAKGKPIKGSGGFDIVIGNPPYINVELIPAADKELYKKYFKCFYKRSDIFALFLENALTNLSSAKAVITFIIPSVVHSNLSYQPLRDIILKNKWLKEVCYTGGNVFNAPTVDTTILICHKQKNNEIILKTAVDFNNHIAHSVPNNYFSMFNNVISIGDKDTDSIFGKLFAPKHPVMESLFTIYQGIVTGNNPAFIFESKQEAIEKGIEEELLHPMCHGRDIERYAVRSRERQMMYVDSTIDVSNYPYAEKWLLQFKDALDKRNEGKHDTISWCSLHRPRVKSELDLKEKILVQNTRNEALKIRIAATLDDQGVYGTQGLNFIIPKTDEFSLRYALGVLNSTLINYLFSTKFLNLAIKADFLKQVHIPNASKTIQHSIETLVDSIISNKKENIASDTSGLESEIDRLVYGLYGLTEEEIKIVEGEAK